MRATSRRRWRHVALCILALYGCKKDKKSDDGIYLYCAADGPHKGRHSGHTYDGETALNEIVLEVLKKQGLDNTIELRSNDDVPNADAKILPDATRIIEYSPAFLSNAALPKDDLKTFQRYVLAHEIAHHINGHTIATMDADGINGVVSPINELRADAFAARYLRAINTPRKQFENALTYASTVLKTSNPPFAQRMQKALAAFDEAPSLQQDLAECQRVSTTQAQELTDTKQQLDSAKHVSDLFTPWSARQPSKHQYHVISIMMDVSYDDGPFAVANGSASAPQRAKALVQISYTLHALADLPPGFFDEEFHTNNSDIKVAWAGSSEPTGAGENGPGFVRRPLSFGMKEGEYKTVVTAAYYDESWPADPNRKIHEFGPLPSTIWDAWIYPNLSADSGGDYIDQLTIIVHSHQKLQAPIKGDAVRRNPGDPKTELQTPVMTEGEVSSVTYSWKSIVPSTNVGVRLRWQPQAAPQ